MMRHRVPRRAINHAFGRWSVAAVPFAMAAVIVAACADESNGEPPGGQTPASAGEQQPAAGQTAPLAVSFDTTTAFVRTATDSHTLRVEIAERDAQRSYGLMDRDVLADDAGMIFLYEVQQPPEAGFWMYRTRIPLDIAYFDGAGRIVAIRQMEPCPVEDQTRCQMLATAYAPGAAYYGALEVNAGWLRDRGVDVGDHVVLPGRLGM